MIRKPALLLLLIIGLTYLFCSEGSITGSNNPSGKIDSLPRSLTFGEQNLISSINEFGFSLLEVINNDKQDENIFISPLSLSMAFGMVYNGARADSKTDIAEVLKYHIMEYEEINESFESLIELLGSLDSKVKFNIANSLWHRPSIMVDEFVDICKDFYNAEVSAVGFSDPMTLLKINQWVSDVTEKKIPRILDEPLSGEEALIAMNAVYFNADWSVQFKPGNTKAESFYNPDGSSRSVEMMNLKTEEIFRYKSTEDFTCLELPYGGYAYSMLLILPDQDSNINNLINDISISDIHEEFFDSTSGNITVKLPKFKFSSGGDFKGYFEDLGMDDAFEGSPGADFSGMFTDRPSRGIDDIIHKAFIEVDESGTTAAAATAISFVDSLPLSFIFNRPFIFLIREKFSNTILFMGKIVEPDIE